MNTRKMPADFARCSGKLHGDVIRDCPLKEKCLRFNSPPQGGGFQQVWLLIYDYGRDCNEFVEIQ